MIQVFHSNQSRHLMAQLADQVAAVRAIDPRGGFSPAHVITPDHRVAAWLKLELARQTGLMAHYHFHEIEAFAASALGRDALAERRTLRARFEAVLRHEPLLREPDMGALLRYLGEDHIAAAEHDAAERDLLERRRFGLAAQLGEIFEAYARARPEVLEGWERSQTFYGGSSGEAVELWQSRLWRATLESHGEVWTPYHAAKALRRGEGKLDRVIHIFLPGTTLRAHYELIDALGTRAVVFCYLYNPSEAFWQDLRFGRVVEQDQPTQEDEEPALSSAGVLGGSMDYIGDDSFWSEEEQVPFLLRSWGYAGGLHIRTFEELPGAERQDMFSEIDASPSLLHAMQQDIFSMTRRGFGSAPPVEGDDSLQILAVANVRREVEVIASEIWRLLDANERARQHDPDVELLRLNEIVVLLPEENREAYQTHIRSVFPATRHLGFNMVDMPARSWSRAMEAVHMLLGLPFGQFRRHELLRLLTHPNLLGQFPNLDGEEWLQWCDDLKILHGADRRDHADTYIKGELFHWDQGLRRLCLGAFMTGKAAQERRVFELYNAHYLPHEYGQGQLVSAGRLVLMARSLIEDAKFCRTARMPLQKWSDFFCRMVATYMCQNEPEDELLLHTTRQLLASMASLDLTGEPVSYRVAYETALELLADVEVRRGQFMLDGVVVMGLEPGRTLPFKATFIAGMNEGAFPRTVNRRPEDLRFAMDERGEIVDPESKIAEAHERDHDKYMFLAALMNTRDHLSISYVAHDARSGEARQPSSLISEIIYAVEQDYLEDIPGEDIEDRARRAEHAIVRRHASRRFHERYFHDVLPSYGEGEDEQPLTPSAQPEAREEAVTLAIRQDLEAHCRTHDIIYPTRELLRATASSEVWQTIKQKLGLVSPPQQENMVNSEGVLRLSTFDIRSFLECPLQGSARFLLRLDEDDEEILLKESELFEPSGRARSMLLRNVFLEKLAREHKESKPFEFKDFYDEQARYFELEGLLPTGPFLRAARERHLKLLERWQENLPLLGAGRSPPMEVRRFGRPVEQELIDVAHPPLSLDMVVGPQRDRVRVEISGRTEVFIPDWPATIIPHSSEQAFRISPKFFMRGFLDQVFMTAVGEHVDRPWTVLVNPAEEALRYKHKNCIRQFKPLDMQTSRQYLRGVIEDMLTQVHAYYMPVEVVFEHMRSEESVAQISERKRRSRWDVTSSDHGPIHEPERYQAPDDAQKIIQKRYGLYFEQLKGKP